MSEVRLEATVDRVEGDLAILEVGDRTIDWPIALLPQPVAEGDAIAIRIERSTSVLDAAKARLERLRATSPPGDDIEL